MTSSTLPLLEQILAIDIGATNIKFCRVDSHGELLESVRRKPTPYPCSPGRLVELLSDRILLSEPTKVGVGFPGDFDNGHVIRPGNLSRPGGVTTDVDPALEAEWIDFPLQDALCEKVHRDVRVVNDAKLAALGCVLGVGVEVVLTLGTGLGLALCVDGTMRRVRDVGAEVFRGAMTFDQLLGERSRASDEKAWLMLLHDTIEKFGSEFGATTVHLAGGNARRVEPNQFPDLAYRIVINGNQASLRGAARLFYG
ncbi:MAG TPA: ROK family protein [Acidimicrobiales bacterium]